MAPVDTITPLGHSQGDADVWRLANARHALILKRHHHPRQYDQARHAYTTWLPHVPGWTPTLIDAVDPHRVLLLSALVDTQPAARQLDSNTAHAVMRQAGAFRAALNELALRDSDPLPLVEAWWKRLDHWCRRARRHLDPEVIEHVRSHDLRCFDQVTRHHCHRDFSPRNWQIEGQGDHARLWVLDFGHARPDGWVIDLVKLRVRAWHQAPSLRDAFLAGLGRSLTARERTQLELITAWHGLATATWGYEHGDPRSIEHGLEILSMIT